MREEVIEDGGTCIPRSTKVLDTLLGTYLDRSRQNCMECSILTFPRVVRYEAANFP